MPITSPATTGMFTVIGPVVVLFCVKNAVVKAFVVVANTGGGVLPLNFTTAMLWLPVDASVGTKRDVMVNDAGAVNQ